jgi:hypothetical protein
MWIAASACPISAWERRRGGLRWAERRVRGARARESVAARSLASCDAGERGKEGRRDDRKGGRDRV